MSAYRLTGWRLAGTVSAKSENESYWRKYQSAWHQLICSYKPAAAEK
jgi:hypothetical protein